MSLGNVPGLMSASSAKHVNEDVMRTKYKLGDRVKVKAGKEHDEKIKDKIGTVAEIGTEALSIKFEGMSKLHKWYVDDEVESAQS